MTSKPQKELIDLIDRINYLYLILFSLINTFVFALLYWYISYKFPTHGLIGPENTNLISFYDSLYFSVVTETTLGYGDYRPVGFSRLLISVQAVLGLTIAGIVVAKITSAHGKMMRVSAYKMTGEWIEIWKASNSNESMISIATIYFDGKEIHYGGINYNSSGTLEGFYRADLVNFSGTLFTFQYSNRSSVFNYFSEGVCSLQFQGSSKDGRWTHFRGITRDFEKSEFTIFEGFRIPPEIAMSLREASPAQRSQYIADRHAEHVGPSTREHL